MGGGKVALGFGLVLALCFLGLALEPEMGVWYP